LRATPELAARFESSYKQSGVYGVSVHIEFYLNLRGPPFDYRPSICEGSERRATSL